MPDEDELDDLVAELWRWVLLRVGRLKSASALWSWMVQIGVNLLRDLGRQGVRREDRRLSLEELTAAELQDVVVPRVVDRSDIGPHGEHFKGILKTLSAVDRELLELYAIDELTHAEIATRLNLPGVNAGGRAAGLHVASDLALTHASCLDSPSTATSCEPRQSRVS